MATALNVRLLFPGIVEPMRDYQTKTVPSKDSPAARCGGTFEMDAKIKDELVDALAREAVQVLSSKKKHVTEEEAKQALLLRFKPSKKNEGFFTIEAKSLWQYPPKLLDQSRVSYDRDSGRDQAALRRMFGRGGNYVNIVLSPFYNKGSATHFVGVNLKVLQFWAEGEHFGDHTDEDSLPTAQATVTNDDVADDDDMFD